jgi:hypothetical protein
VRVWAPAAGGGAYHTGSSFAAPFVTAAVAARLAAGAPPERERIAARLAAASSISARRARRCDLRLGPGQAAALRARLLSRYRCGRAPKLSRHRAE